MSKPIVYVVHCVDTEGPLEETLEATFERLRKERNIDFPPSLHTLEALQRKEIDLGGQEDDIADYLSPSRLSYLSTWQSLEKMVLEVTDQGYRKAHASPDGNLYTFSWFIVDVVGYKDNPRRKATGFHTIWDKYQRILKDRFFNDIFGWHFHTVPPTHDALHYNTSWTNNDFHEQVLARRVIERQWFPSLFRAGGVIERNDLSYWLERFIPFDYSNQNNKYATFKAGDQSDWRHAPTKWMPYHPSFYDYRKKGNMKRSIFRCLDVKNMGCILDESEVREAFQQAQESGHAILAYTNHDRRDMRPEITHMHRLIEATAKDFPEVQWQYSNALAAARSALNISCNRPLEIQLSVENNILKIRSNQPLFTGDLFLAVEERGGIFYRDNTTIESDTEWAYSSPRWDNIVSVGVGAVTSDGQSTCASLKLEST
jgi:hypothetical protein